MIRFRAIIPLNLGADCKTRLAPAMPPHARTALVLAMARHVIEALRGCDAISSIAMLAPAKPPFDDVGWLADAGAGLNAELARLLAAPHPATTTATATTLTPTLILHADLPLLTAADVAAICDGASANKPQCEAAIAPDHSGSGTNALALLRPGGFTPCFGPGSFAQHQAALPHAAIIRREGLGVDVDTPADLAALLARDARWDGGLDDPSG